MTEKEKAVICKRTTRIYGWTFVLLIVLPILASFLFDGEGGYWLAFSTFPGLLVFCKVSICYRITEGWKVKKTMMILGYPLKIAIIAALPFAILVFLEYATLNSTDWLHPQTAVKLHIMVFSGMLGFIGTLIYWYGGMRVLTALLSEYDVRYAGKLEKLDTEEVEAEVAILKKHGVM